MVVACSPSTTSPSGHKLGQPRVIDTKFKNFFDEIDDVVEADDVDVITAIVYWCERAEVEIESVVPLIKSNPVFLARMQEDAEDLNFLKKITRLPL